MATRALASVLLLTVLAGCGGTARLPVEAGTGPSPQLPSPQTSLIPTVNVAEAVGWPAGRTPAVADGLQVNAFASSLDHPRWLYVLPNGDVLVAESAAPPKPPARGVKAWFMRRFMKKAGSAVPSADRITLLRDADGDGNAETRSVLLSGLRSPFGMALAGGALYVANTDSIVRFPWRDGVTEIRDPGTKIADLPAGPKNQHWTRSLVADRTGERLYVAVGSASNVAEHGFAEETGRAAVHEVDLSTGGMRVFASGLRNPVGLAWNPADGRLWVTVNERDELGSDLVPDYMTSLQDGGFYGWPYVYFGTRVDRRVPQNDPALIARAVTPDYALGPHTASLGLTFTDGSRLGSQYAHGVFVGQHGSWNRKPRSGYKVIFVPFEGARPSGSAVDVLTGFLSDDGEAFGRPVGVVIDQRGALLVADDVGNVIWRVSAGGQSR